MDSNLNRQCNANVLKPEENSSKVRYPLASVSKVSKTLSSSSALRGSSPFNLYNNMTNDTDVMRSTVHFASPKTEQNKSIMNRSFFFLIKHLYA